MRKLLLALTLVLSLAVPAAASDLTVSAAASLTDAFGAVKTAFAKEHPGVNVTMTLLALVLALALAAAHAFAQFFILRPTASLARMAQDMKIP